MLIRDLIGPDFGNATAMPSTVAFPVAIVMPAFPSGEMPGWDRSGTFSVGARWRYAMTSRPAVVDAGVNRTSNSRGAASCMPNAAPRSSPTEHVAIRVDHSSIARSSTSSKVTGPSMLTNASGDSRPAVIAARPSPRELRSSTAPGPVMRTISSLSSTNQTGTTRAHPSARTAASLPMRAPAAQERAPYSAARRTIDHAHTPRLRPPTSGRRTEHRLRPRRVLNVSSRTRSRSRTVRTTVGTQRRPSEMLDKSRAD